MHPDVPFPYDRQLFFSKNTRKCVYSVRSRLEWDKNLYSPHEVHTSYVLFTYDRIVYSQYE